MESGMVPEYESINFPSQNRLPLRRRGPPPWRKCENSTSKMKVVKKNRLRIWIVPVLLLIAALAMLCNSSKPPQQVAQPVARVSLAAGNRYDLARDEARGGHTLARWTASRPSRERTTRAEARKVPCRRCGALAGNPCRGVHGGDRGDRGDRYPHRRRRRHHNGPRPDNQISQPASNDDFGNGGGD